MKRFGTILLLVFLASCSKTVAATTIDSLWKNPDGVTLMTKSGPLTLQVFSPTVIRVFFKATDSSRLTKGIAIISKPAHTSWRLTETSDEVHLRTDAIEVRVTRATGLIKFY